MCVGGGGGRRGPHSVSRGFEYIMLPPQPTSIGWGLCAASATCIVGGYSRGFPYSRQPVWLQLRGHMQAQCEACNLTKVGQIWSMLQNVATIVILPKGVLRPCTPIPIYTNRKSYQRMDMLTEEGFYQKNLCQLEEGKVGTCSKTVRESPSVCLH